MIKQRIGNFVGGELRDLTLRNFLRLTSCTAYLSVYIYILKCFKFYYKLKLVFNETYTNLKLVFS